MQDAPWSISYDAPPVLDAAVLDLAARHLGLGDEADQIDLLMIVQSAARLASEWTGRAVGQCSVRFRCALPAAPVASITLPLCASPCAASSVSVDGVALSPAQYALSRGGRFWRLGFTPAVSGASFEASYTVGSGTIDDADLRLLLVLAGDLYRCRESAGVPETGSITARLLADSRRVRYDGPWTEP